MKIKYLPKIFILFLSLTLLVSCGWIRKNALKLSESDLKNAEVSRQVALNLLSTWELNSGALDCALGEKGKAVLPDDAVKAWKKLDELAVKSEAELTDRDLGCSLGLRVRMAKDIITEAIKQYFPDLIDLLPMVFGF